MVVFDGEKKRLVISSCKVDDGKISVEKDQFEVMLNPSECSLEQDIAYNKIEALGQIGSDQKFCSIKPETLSFKIVLDGTGAVPYPSGGGALSVKELIKKLDDIVSKYDGEKHEPNIVQVLWGSLIFYGRMSSKKIEYTMYKPSGEPLRASVSLGFESYLSREEEALRANKSSPDLTHGVEFKAGDSLPLLCYRIYKDASYYAEVARANNIVNFRQIEPGTRIWFPPLR
nr:hypothetical protein [uncultured Desulfobacter sp.]